MPRKTSTVAEEFVPHPRYGALPKPSGLRVSEEELRDGFWRLGREKLYPDSALLADTSKQNFAVFPRKYYVDVRRVCRTCHRPFIFFAREQRYWFETLRFFVDADCVYCPLCRRESRHVQRRLRRYSDLYSRPTPTSKELMFMVEDATFLLERGVLKNLNNIGRVKNLAARTIPEYPGVKVLAQALTAALAARSAA
jgi:Probable zinc-ribbon domain